MAEAPPTEGVLKVVPETHKQEHESAAATTETVKQELPKAEQPAVLPLQEVTTSQAQGPPTSTPAVAAVPPGHGTTTEAKPSAEATSAAVVTEPKEPAPTPASAPAGAAGAGATPAPVEAVPDPDEDDLDDLDDVLDDFAATKLDAAPPASTDATDATAAPPVPFLDPNAPPVDEEAFARDLQAGMADLLGELESSPEMQKQFEEMLRELGAASGQPGAGMPPAAAVAAAAAAAGGEGAPGSSEGPPQSFQDSIKRTMERMQASGEAAGQAATEAGDNDIMAALLKEMESGGLGNEEDFSKILMGMMEQLTNKEILYEPMKELDTKFPEWMAKNKDKTSASDLARYETQQRIVKEIVGKFEASDYTDENAEYRQYIVERMQQMQAAGSPPADLVGDINAAQEALSELDSGCPTQ